MNETGYLKPKTFNNIVIILFILFLGVYFVSKNGYYESTLYRKKELTEQQIIQFEEDIKNNVEVDIKEYLPKEEDNSNFISRGAYNFSQLLSNLLTDKCKDIWNLIKTLFIS